jgi:hypothetical protein
LEFRRAFASPFETPSAIVLNVFLIALGWWLLPQPLRGFLFGYSGAHALPLTLLSWMVSDIPATNVLGGDAERMTQALGMRRTLLNMLLAKALVLWLLTAPFCIVLDFAITAGANNVAASALTTTVIALVPFATLGLASWVGILLPYKPMPLSARRRQFRQNPARAFRWLCAVLAPYVVVPILNMVCLAPLHVWGLPGDSHRVLGYQFTSFWLVMVSALGLALIMLVIGYRGALMLAERRTTKLVDFLTSPDLG